MDATCNVCGNSPGEPIFQSAGEISVTSVARFYRGRTVVYFCRHCDHTQTAEVPDIDAYYDQGYKILAESDEEDHLYKVIGGRKIYRLEHQAETFLAKTDLPKGARVLDYGCAKGGSLRRIAEARPDVVPFLFDVSRDYVPFWKKFVRPAQWATYTPDPAWEGTMDAVTSFFALEHVADPNGMLASIARLLKPGGLFYCVIPNVFTNIADFVVVDHINHFSPNSLRYLFSRAGFETVEMDEQVHDGAFVIQAIKAGNVQPFGRPADSDVQRRILAIRDYWQGLADQVRDFERAHAGEPAAIYGAGFYGNYLATCLEEPERIECFVDQNPFLHGKSILEKPIVPPTGLPGHIRLVYAGLRPDVARRNIEAIDCFRERGHHYFYLQELGNG